MTEHIEIHKPQIKTGALQRSVPEIKRVVKGSEPYSLPGSRLTLLHVYPTQHALDEDEALEKIPKTYEGMWNEAMDNS